MADHADSTERSIGEPPKILVPVRVLEGQTLPEPLIDFLATAEVVILGYHVLPEQTPAEQASLQFEERARAAVDDIARNFREAGRAVETRVAFTHDRDQTVERVASEVGATALLLSNPVADVETLLVAVRGALDTERLADLVATLIGGADSTVTVTLLGVAGAAGFDVETALGDARATLLDRGLPAERLRTETTVTENPVSDIVDRSDRFDVIVMGESEETLLSMLFGEAPARVAAGAVSPVLIVRKPPADETA